MSAPTAASRRWTSLDLAGSGFHYTRTPMLLIDADGVVSHLNVACRELFGMDAAGCKGRPFSYLVGRLVEKGGGPVLPPCGPVTSYLGAPDVSRGRAVLLATADLGVATCDFVYHSDHLGPLSLRTSELPRVEAESGAYAGSAVSFEPVGAAGAEAFRQVLDRGLAREVMWDVYAASYDRLLPETPFYQEVLHRHVAALSAEAIRTVLDIGAGTGNVTERLLRLGKRVTAVDVGRAMLMRLHAKLSGADADRLTVIEDTAEHLPHLGDASFDGANVLLALFAMQDAGRALAEAIRLLRPGGKLVVTEPRPCFDARQLFVAAEASLRSRGVFEEYAADWARVESVGPLIQETIAGKRWYAETICEYLGQLGFTGLAFRESHLGNCATVEGTKPA